MAGRAARTCDNCGSSVGFSRADDGFFYCRYCNSQADDIRDTAIDDEELFSHYTASCSRARPANITITEPISAEPLSQVKPTASQFLDHHDILDIPDDDDDMADGVGPTQPSDFGFSMGNYSYEDYYTEIRKRYVTGLQMMIQMQAEALVMKFNVSPLIVGLVGTLWLRFLASTRVLAEEWANQAILDSETQTKGEGEEVVSSGRLVNANGKHVASVWCASLRNKLPISCSLAISFLACHVAREPILPTDLLKWALEGKLPYFAAHVEIEEKQLGSRSKAFPISFSRLLRPVRPISSQKLESMTANIAQTIGLKLPPVNFYAIASRYLRELSLPTEELLPSALRIYEWSMPSELYLSANEFRIPTRAYVMSVLIVAIRIMFDINGYGMWESGFSSPNASPEVKNQDNESKSRPNETENADNTDPSVTKDPKLSVLKLLQILDARYHELADTHEYSYDLPAYLQYCKNVVFSGLSPQDAEERELINKLWKFYEDNKGAGTSDENERPSDDSGSKKDEAREKGDRDQYSARSSRIPEESPKERAIRRLKMDMEENQFCYIRPRVKVKRRDYLHYSRKKKEVLIYAVHADYYILLRSCAKIALVETRIMHIAVLGLERRLQWLEKRIDHSLSSLDDGCEFCESKMQNDGDNP